MNWNIRRTSSRFYLMLNTSEIIQRYVSYLKGPTRCNSNLKGWSTSIINYNIFSRMKDYSSDPSKGHVL
jgi:hypothetical protein